MKKKLSLLFLALVATIGAWANVTVTIVDGTNAPYETYGTRNTSATPNTFTSNAASGMEGLVISAPVIDRATWWSTYCLGVKNSAAQTDENVTFTAPTGYVIKNISMTVQAISSNNSYDVTVNGVTTRVTGASAKEYSNITVNASSFSFTINSVSETVNWLAVKSMNVTLGSEVMFDPDDVAGKTFTLQCARGYVYWNGSAMKGHAYNASKFAIVSYDSDNDSNNETYLYDVTNNAFVCHTTLGWTGSNGNSAVESSNDFSKAVKNISFGSTNIATYPYYIAETVYNTWLNMDGTPNVYFNTWTNFESGNGGNTYKIAVVDTDFDQAAAVAMLDAYFNPSATVKYVISDASGVVLETDFAPVTVGDVITSLPNNLQRAFCSYSEINHTIEAGENIINVTVTYDLPFETGTDKLYYAKLRGHYVYYDETNNDVRTNQSSKENTDAYQWSFYGNPYSGIKVKNAKTGTYLDNTSSTVQLTESGYAWTIHRLNDSSTFGLFNGTNHINEQNHTNHNLIYWWAFETDAGSQWNVEEVPFVTYVVKDAGNNVLFTSEQIPVNLNTTITTLPEEYQRPAFYTYNTVDVTISTGGNTNVEFTATPKADAPVKFTADTTNPYYYNLSIRSKYLVYSSEATGQVTLQNESEPFNAYASWAFIGNPYAFKLINKKKGTGDFLTYTSVVIQRHSDNNVQFVSSDDFTDQYWTIDTNTNGIVFRMKNNTSIYFHHDIGKNYLRTCSVTEWSNVHNDAGSTLVASTDEDVLIALYEELSGLSIGEYYGQYYSTSSEMTNAQAEQAILLVGQLINNSQTAGYADAYAALLQVKTNLAQKVPAPGFYRLKNVATGKYLNTVKATNSYNSTDRGVYANGGAVDASTIIELREQSNGTLFMYNQGYGYGWVIAGGEVGSGVVFATSSPDKYVHWFPGNKANQVAFAICYGNGEGSYASYLTKGIFTVDTDDNSVIGGTDYTIDAAQWVIEEATSATVALNGPVAGSYYATFCVPFDVTFNGATAYTLSKGETELTMTEVSGTVAAGTPVLLVGTSETATATIGTNYSSAISTETALTGSYLEIAEFDGTTNYVLGTDGTKVGFFHWDGDVLKANRAYIAGEAAGGAKGFYLDDSFATAIQKLTDAADGNAIYYDLSGRRVAEPKQGLYIVNGKKVVVK